MIADFASASWVFDLHDSRNSLGTMAPHIIFVGRVCLLADSGAALVGVDAWVAGYDYGHKGCT